MKKVVVGISGGVDSSVAALLLMEQGYEVIGLYMRNWDSTANNDINGNPTNDDDICPQEADYNDAKLVCDKLGIELHRADFVEEYWDNVFTYFLEELKRGRTPNPDIMCNKYIKFDAFKKEALKLGADYIATGHYARVDHSSGKPIMLKGVDNNKDQTYFLSQLSSEQLENVLFPVGDIDKSEVRKLALEHQLATATKKDSTGICFIGERNFKQFLSNYLPAKPGEMVNIDTNEVVGKHYGLMNHTIGQRRGLGIGGKGDAWFAVGKNLEKNYLYVAQGSDNNYLSTTSCIVEMVNWIVKPKEKTFDCNAKFRYRQKDNQVSVEIIDETHVLVRYNQGVNSVTPGQAAVFYDGDVCLGGGIIKEVRRDDQKLWYL